MAKRPSGPGRLRADWFLAQRGRVVLCYYWRPWGRSGPLRWYVTTGPAILTPGAFLDEWEKRMARKPGSDDFPKLAELSAAYGSWERLCPELGTWLCDGCYSDGQPKGDVTITLRRNVTTITATLKVEDGGLCLRASGDTPDDALVALELLLTARKVPWEVDPYPLGGGRKKKK